MLPRGASEDLRASDADREAAGDRLRTAAIEGRLDSSELEERMAAAYAARWCSELAALTADVTPAPPPQAALGPIFVRPTAPTNGLAIASLVVGILWMWWIGSILAVVFGHLALRQIAHSPSGQSGRGMAIAGLVLGYAGLVLLPVAVLGIVVD